MFLVCVSSANCSHGPAITHSIVGFHPFNTSQHCGTIDGFGSWLPLEVARILHGLDSLVRLIMLRLLIMYYYQSMFAVCRRPNIFISLVPVQRRSKKTSCVGWAKF